MNSEGMEDRYYFSDWDDCTCDPMGSAFAPECPFFDRHEEHEDE